jgi:hypothetical protein
MSDVWMVTKPGEEPRPATKWEVGRLMVRMRRRNYEALFRAVGWPAKETVPITVPPETAS